MLKILKSGFYTTLQDRGRFGYRHKGVPVSGTMDDLARHRINTLLENNVSSALLEITMVGPTLMFDAPTYICLGGAELSATINNEPVENYRVYKIQAGDILSYGKLQNGFRAYLGIKNGFDLDLVLGSASLYIPLTKTNTIADGTTIDYVPTRDFEAKITSLKVRNYLEKTDIPVLPGPEFELLSNQQQTQLFTQCFTVSKDNNRMAYQIQEPIAGHSHTILTSATLPGTVQLTPAGKLIILMKDGQTTGGYPRILQLNQEALSILAQKRTGSKINFSMLQPST